jgi:hypothetical protein
MKARGADTVGQLAVMESTYPGGLTVPPHVHDGEDDAVPSGGRGARILR